MRFYFASKWLKVNAQSINYIVMGTLFLVTINFYIC